MRVAIGDPAASLGGGVAYPSGSYQSVGLGDYANSYGATLSPNTDYLFPFVPRADVTIDKLYYFRRASGGNVALGWYNNSGTRLDDVALDSDATAGYHERETTNFELSAGDLYWFLVNTNAASAVTSDLLSPTDQNVSAILTRAHGIPGGMYSGGVAPTGGVQAVGLIKSRTNAVAPSTITMSGWSASDDVVVGGIIVA